MSVNKNGFIKALGLRASGDRGWYVCTCIFCKKKDRFGVTFTTSDGQKPHWHCFKCGKSGTMHFLAKYIGRNDLVSGEYVAPMEVDAFAIDREISLDMPKCSVPIGFRRMYEHPYLDKRKITLEQRNKFQFGNTRIDPNIGEEYITMLIEEGGHVVAYVSRSTYDKDWIDSYNDKTGTDYPRYKNSESDFERIVWGLDEIVIGTTTTVIVVEGKYDKLATDRKLELYSSDEIKCVCTFGTKISEVQCMKLFMKGITNIIVMYDSGTVDKSKKVSRTLSSWFKNVKIAELFNGDPDEHDDHSETSQEELILAIENSRSHIDFAINTLDINKFTL